MRELIEVEQNLYREYWDFKDIEQDIRELFPDLSEETIEKSSNMILGKK